MEHTPQKKGIPLEGAYIGNLNYFYYLKSNSYKSFLLSCLSYNLKIKESFNLKRNRISESVYTE